LLEQLLILLMVFLPLPQHQQLLLPELLESSLRLEQLLILLMALLLVPILQLQPHEQLPQLKPLL
jgi:hypothetical protein